MTKTKRDTVNDRLQASVARRQEKNNPDAGPSADRALVRQGVTVGWLADTLDLPLQRVKKHLRDCPVARHTKEGPLYKLATAIDYLAKPKVNIEEYLKTVKPEDLPARFQDTYWSAMNKRQKWEENAKELWRTDDVMLVLGRVFQTMKFQLQLFPDTVERAHGLTKEQRDQIITMTDALQNDIYGELQEAVQQYSTTATVTEGVTEKKTASDKEDGHEHPLL